MKVPRDPECRCFCRLALAEALAEIEKLKDLLIFIQQ